MGEIDMADTTPSSSPRQGIPSMIFSRRLPLAALLLASAFLFLVLNRSSHVATDGYLPRLRQPQRSDLCAANLTLLRHHGLVNDTDENIKYSQLRLTPSFSFASSHQKNTRIRNIDVDLPKVSSLYPETLAKAAQILSDHTDTSHDRKNAISSTQASLSLPPRPKKQPDASHIIFGVATTVKRLNDSLEPFSYWGANNGARFHAVVKPDDGVTEVLRRAREMKINLEISESDAEMDNRYFSHVESFQKLKDEHTEWMAFIDDDTFFLSMAHIINMLDQYPASKPQYIGGLSENSDQVALWGLWGFGGAGVFVSTPLMDVLAEHYEECYAYGRSADWRIAQCIYQHTTTKLSWEQGLHQMDLAMDQSGFYESGRQLPLSIHHWKSWFHLDVVPMTSVASICGPECVLERFYLRDGWILTNGFSIVKYGDGWAGDDATIEKTWQTWDEERKPGKPTSQLGGNFLHSLGPLRERDDKKQSYRLAAVDTDTPGVVRQFYASQFNVEKGAVVEVCWQGR